MLLRVVLQFVFLRCSLCALHRVAILHPEETYGQTNLTVHEHEESQRLVYTLHSTAEFSVRQPKFDTLRKTSSQSEDCTWASNGGPFHRDGSAVGVVVADGVVRHERYGGVGFGLTRDGQWWVVGKPEPADLIHLEHFVTGFDWLVRDGRLVAKNNTTGAKYSARTAVGTDWEGRVIVIVADGCEKCWNRRGLELVDLANEAIKAGARHAINLDGGGSSVLVREGLVYSKPTCLDLPVSCERNVATILCVHDGLPDKEVLEDLQ